MVYCEILAGWNHFLNFRVKLLQSFKRLEGSVFGLLSLASTFCTEFWKKELVKKCLLSSYFFASLCKCSILLHVSTCLKRFFVVPGPCF